MKASMKILSYLSIGSNYRYFDLPIETHKELLTKFGDAYNDWERSYKQYQCQCIFMPVWSRVGQNIVAAVVFPLVLLFLLFKCSYSRRGEKCDAIGEFKGMPEIVPDVLNREFKINIDYWFSGTHMNISDIIYTVKLAVYCPLSPLFVIKNALKIAKYSYMIYCHSPRAIIVHNEYSFTSSVLTDYCHHHGVQHIDVMHGEKLFNIRDAYFHYDRTYVWDEYYINLFRRLKAEPSQFIVAAPESLNIDCGKYQDSKYYADYKYYLAVVSEEKLKNIIASMSFAAAEGKSVKYRLHPRYTDVALAERLVGKKHIEYPKEVSIMSSVANCGCVVGCYTTVLNQATHSGKAILLDDMAEKEMFDKLKDFDYIVMLVDLSMFISL